MTSPATSTMLESLPTEQRLQLKQSATILQRRWQEQLNVETIERFMAESLDLLAPNARSRPGSVPWSLTNDRLRALVRLRTPRPTSTRRPLPLHPQRRSGRRWPLASCAISGPNVDVFSG
jgi:hypothetical protein